MLIELEFKLMVGEIQYRDIETGYWVLNEGGMNYRIVDIPYELKKNGLKLAVMAQILESEDSIYATTLNIKIIEFKILENYGKTS